MSNIMLADALNSIDGDFSFAVDTDRSNLHRNVVIITAPKDVKFTYWSTDVSREQRGYPALYITPAYHPFKRGMKSAEMVNGHTNSVIGGRFVRSLFCPLDVRSSVGKRSLDSWSYVTHPYLVKSDQLIIGVDMKLAQDQSSLMEFQNVMGAALGVAGRFIEINGGFNAPLPNADSVRTLLANGTKRGSESTCVWQYRTLEQENQLSGADIPDWFLNEGWLEAYKNIDLDFEHTF